MPSLARSVSVFLTLALATALPATAGAQRVRKPARVQKPTKTSAQPRRRAVQGKAISNRIVKPHRFAKATPKPHVSKSRSQKNSRRGAVRKTALVFIVSTLVVAEAAYQMVFNDPSSTESRWLIARAIGGFVAALWAGETEKAAYLQQLKQEGELPTKTEAVVEDNPAVAKLAE